METVEDDPEYFSLFLPRLLTAVRFVLLTMTNCLKCGLRVKWKEWLGMGATRNFVDDSLPRASFEMSASVTIAVKAISEDDYVDPL